MLIEEKKISIHKNKLKIVQTQPNFQQYKGAQKDRCSNIVKVHKGIERQNTNKTVNETGYHDHDMQTDTAFEHLEQIS